MTRGPGQFACCVRVLIRGSGCSHFSPRYSPDGQHLAFPFVDSRFRPSIESPPEPARYAIGITRPDGTGLERVELSNFVTRLAWSPTGDQLLLERSFEAGQCPFAIFLASLDGAELGQLTAWTPRGRPAPQPDWSSTGQIAFVRIRGDCRPCEGNIFVMRQGGLPRRVTCLLPCGDHDGLPPPRYG